jgi:large subunit ribosomal protein L10
MNREQKAATIATLASEIERADAVFAVDYRGISVPQAAELRTKLRDADASFRVVKNSLTERAAERAGAQALKALLEGPTALTFVHGDAALAAKAIADYARVTQLLPFKGGLLDGDTLDAEQVRAISRLPSRDALYGQLVGVVASPVTGLVRTLNALIGGLAVALGQVREKKESGEIPAGDPPASSSAAAEESAAAPTANGSSESASAGDPAATAEPAAAADPAAADPSDPAPADEAPADGVAAEVAATEEAPAEEVEDSPVSDEAPAGEVGAEPADRTAPGAQAPGDDEQAEPEGTPDHQDKPADASA